MTANAETGAGLSAEADYPPRLQAWTMVLILLVLYLISGLDKNIVALLADDIGKQLELTDQQLGLLLGPAFAISFAFGALPWGWAMDRFDRRKILGLGVVTMSLGTICSGISKTFPQLLVSRTIVGGGESVLIPGNQSIITDIFPPERLAFPFAVCSMGLKLGEGISFAVGGLLVAVIAPSAVLMVPVIGDMHGWQAILVIVGTTGSLFALSLLFVQPPPRRNLVGAGGGGSGYGRYLRYMKENPRFFIGTHLGGALGVTVSAIVNAWGPVHFIRSHGLATSEVGVWLGAVMVAGPIIGLPIHGLVIDRLFRKGKRDVHARYLSIMFAVAALPLVAAFLVTDYRVGFVLLAVGNTLFGVFGMLGPVVLQMMLPGHLRGKGAAVLALVTALAGMSLGPVLVATISQTILGDAASIGLAAAICIGVCLPAASALYALALKPISQSYRNANPQAA
ncbi:MAG: MFS transporter [Novosphingobium sp.]|nr:MFS transporter [Novosphingobium sp.]MCP5403716.1 MFS transporter [Novosphingobium sp.]